MGSETKPRWFFERKWRRVLFVLVVMGLATGFYISLTTRSTIPQPWTGILYNTGDGGLVRVTLNGAFPTRDLCVNIATQMLGQRQELLWESCGSQCFANRFLCGKDCEFPLFGNAFISEVKCSDSYDGPK
jgi:hypothetical protein